MMESAAAFVSHSGAFRRQAGFPILTPDELGQIDLGNKSSLNRVVWIVCPVVISLVSVVVALRLIVRRRTTGRLFLDDGLVVLATVFTLVLCAVTLAATRYGLGEHVWNMAPASVMDDLKRCIQFMLVGNVFYALAIAFTKLSIVASYLHIFSPSGVMCWLMWATAAVTAGLLVASVPATVFQCRPVAAAWDFSLPRDGCYTFVNFLYASTAINTATDLVLCIAPLPYFWRLQLPVRQKVLVSVLFFLGGFACVASIVRLAYLGLLDSSHIDLTYNLVSSVMWTMAECTIGIVCVSLPALRPLMGLLLPRLFASRPTTARRSGLASHPRRSLSGASAGSTLGSKRSTAAMSAPYRADRFELADVSEASLHPHRLSWIVLPAPLAHAGTLAWKDEKDDEGSAGQ